jgi:DNA polymerase V
MLIARRKTSTAPELELAGRPDPAAAPMRLPLFNSRIQAGFPSPADDYVEGALDLNRHLIRNPPATFFLRVQGDSMLGAGIHPGDLLVVDRSIEPKHGSVVIAVLDGELTVKRLWRPSPERVELRAENPAFPPIVIQEFQQFELWGVVTNVIHPLLP